MLQALHPRLLVKQATHCVTEQESASAGVVPTTIPVDAGNSAVVLHKLLAAVPTR